MLVVAAAPAGQGAPGPRARSALAFSGAPSQAGGSITCCGSWPRPRPVPGASGNSKSSRSKSKRLHQRRHAVGEAATGHSCVARTCPASTCAGGQHRAEVGGEWASNHPQTFPCQVQHTVRLLLAVGNFLVSCRMSRKRAHAVAGGARAHPASSAAAEPAAASHGVLAYPRLLLRIQRRAEEAEGAGCLRRHHVFTREQRVVRAARARALAQQSAPPRRHLKYIRRDASYIGYAEASLGFLLRWITAPRDPVGSCWFWNSDCFYRSAYTVES